MLIKSLALLGFTSMAASCDIAGLRCEYGSPYADYQVQGKVVDSDGGAIPGIRMSVISRMRAEGTVYTDTLCTPMHTYADGSYDFDFSYYPKDSLVLLAEDTDGPENGGRFRNTEVVIPKNKMKRKAASKRWYVGAFSTEVRVIMEKAE